MWSSSFAFISSYRHIQLRLLDTPPSDWYGFRFWSNLVMCRWVNTARAGELIWLSVIGYWRVGGGVLAVWCLSCSSMLFWYGACGICNDFLRRQTWVSDSFYGSQACAFTYNLGHSCVSQPGNRGVSVGLVVAVGRRRFMAQVMCEWQVVVVFVSLWLLVLLVFVFVCMVVCIAILSFDWWVWHHDQWWFGIKHKPFLKWKFWVMGRYISGRGRHASPPQKKPHY